MLSDGRGDQENNEDILRRNTYSKEKQPRLDAWDKPSDLVLWEDLVGGGGEGGGRGDRDGEDM